HAGRVVWMHPLEHELYGWFDRWVVAKDAKGFLRPEDFAGGYVPAKAPGMTEPLRFRQGTPRFAAPSADVRECWPHSEAPPIAGARLRRVVTSLTSSDQFRRERRAAHTRL